MKKPALEHIDLGFITTDQFISQMESKDELKELNTVINTVKNVDKKLDTFLITLNKVFEDFANGTTGSNE